MNISLCTYQSGFGYNYNHMEQQIDQLDFPKDHYQQLIFRYAHFRKEALKRSLDFLKDELHHFVSVHVEFTPSLSSSRPETSTTTTTTTTPSQPVSPISPISLYPAPPPPLPLFTYTTSISDAHALSTSSRHFGPPDPTWTRILKDKSFRDVYQRIAAAVILQKTWRGYRDRMRVGEVQYGSVSGDEERPVTAQSTLSKGRVGKDVDERRIVWESIIDKYERYETVLVRLRKRVLDFPEFCAVLIQSNFRGYRIRKRMDVLKTIPEVDRKEAAAHLLIAKKKRRGPGHGSIEEQIIRIQKAWRSYYVHHDTYSPKVFRFYKELIRFRLRGDPKVLMKLVNPREASLIDSALGVHVRFRLGGEKFPPTIYYKIFTHKTVVDMNAFSPREYTSSETKQPLPLERFNKMVQEGIVPSGWYVRFENNGWRPVSDKVLDEEDEVSKRTASKVSAFHYSKVRRQQEVAMERKRRKMEWLRKVYTLAGAETVSDQTNGVDPLLAWTQTLDFEAYQHLWLTIATTGKSDDCETYSMETQHKQSGKDAVLVDETRLTSALSFDKSRPHSGRSVGDLLLNNSASRTSSARRYQTQPLLITPPLPMQ